MESPTAQNHPVGLNFSRGYSNPIFVMFMFIFIRSQAFDDIILCSEWHGPHRMWERMWEHHVAIALYS
jgi:hypothetical protein